MALEVIEYETAPQPVASVIVLHGLGADGRDFLPVAEELDLQALGGVRFVFPHAPKQAVTVNGGVVMRAWYDILDAELDRQEDEAGMRSSQAAVADLISKEIKRGIPASRIVLMGFSQGCATILLAGLRYPARLAGLVCLSGYLPLAATTAAERHVSNAELPIFQAHGRSDTVVPIELAEAAHMILQGLGHPLEWHEYAMQHSVCSEEIADLNRWLLKLLS
jgi:phospholipase/carboxylesterase